MKFSPQSWRVSVSLFCALTLLSGAAATESATTYTLKKMEVITVKYAMGGLDAAANIHSSNRTDVAAGTTRFPSDWAFSWDTGSFSYQGNLETTLPLSFTAGNNVPVTAKADASWTTAGYGYDRRPGIRLEVGAEFVEKFTPNPIANGSFSVNDAELSRQILTASDQTGEYHIRIKMFAAFGPGSFGILSCCGSGVRVEVDAVYVPQVTPPAVTSATILPFDNDASLPMKDCVTAGSSTPGVLGFRPIAAQPAVGIPLFQFPAAPPMPGTPINCTVQFDVRVARPDARSDFYIEVNDVLSAGLSYQGILRSSLSDSSGSVGAFTAVSMANGVRFTSSPFRNPVDVPIKTYSARIEYVVVLNNNGLPNPAVTERNSADVTVYSINLETTAVTDHTTQPLGTCQITDSTPSLQCRQILSSETGAPGDRRTITVIVDNPGRVFLSNVQIQAQIPPFATLVPSSANPPTAPGGPPLAGALYWTNLGNIDAGGSVAVSYDVTIDAGAPAGLALQFQAFVTAQAPLIGVLGFFATLNSACAGGAITVVIPPWNPNIALDLAASPTRGCGNQAITYTAVVHNTGSTFLNVTVPFVQGTVVVANPPPILGLMGPGESKTVTATGRIGPLQAGQLVTQAQAVGAPVDAEGRPRIPALPNVNALANVGIAVVPPVITSVVPAAAPASTEDLELTIEGACFVPGATVSIAPGDGIELIPGEPPNYGFEGPNELRQRIRLLPGAPALEHHLFVRNPNGDVGGNEPYNLFAVGGVPRISRIEPTSGRAGDPVTLLGGNFAVGPADNLVLFGDLRADVLSGSVSRIVVHVPSGLPQTSVPVTVVSLVRPAMRSTFTRFPPPSVFREWPVTFYRFWLG